MPRQNDLKLLPLTFHSISAILTDYYQDCSKGSTERESLAETMIPNPLAGQTRQLGISRDLQFGWVRYLGCRIVTVFPNSNHTSWDRDGMEKLPVSRQTKTSTRIPANRHL